MPNPFFRRTILPTTVFLGAALCSTLQAPKARAAALTWDPLNTANGATIDDGAGNWNTASAWNNAGVNQTWAAGDTATFTGTVGGTVAGNASTNGIAVNGTQNYTFSGALSGAGALTQNGTGTLTLSGANTYSGGTNINAGTLSMNLTSRSGSVAIGAVAVGGAGTLDLHNTNIAVDNILLTGTTQVTGSGTITKTGAGYVSFWNDTDGIKDFAGLVDIQQGSLGSNGNGWQNSAGLMNVNISAGAAFDIRTQNVVINNLTGSGTIGSSHNVGVTFFVGNNNGSSTFDGAIKNGNAGTWTGGLNTGVISLTKNGTGTLTLTGTSSYTGLTSINAGVLSVSSIGNAASAGNVGTNLVLPYLLGGTLRYTGAGETTNRTIELGANATSALDASGSGALVIAGYGGGAGQSGNRTLTLTGTSTAANTLNGAGGVLRDLSSGNLSIIKSGSGTWVLTGANTYTGTTTVGAGTLLVNGTHAAGAGTYAVGAGGKLGGTGTLTSTGAMTIDGQISGGDFGTVGTLNLAGAGSRTLTGTYLFDVDYGTGTGDVLNITGATAVNINGGTFQLGTALGAAPAAGAHYAIKLFQSNIADAATASGQSNFAHANGLASYQSIVTWDGGKTYYLVPEPASFALLGLSSLLLLRRRGRARKAV